MSAFIKVAHIDDLKPGQAKAIAVADLRIALFNVAGTYYAVEDYCPHKGAPLASGMVGGGTVSCEWHGATFELDSGKCTAGPGGQGINTYPVRVIDEDIEIEL